MADDQPEQKTETKDATVAQPKQQKKQAKDKVDGQAKQNNQAKDAKALRKAQFEAAAREKQTPKLEELTLEDPDAPRVNIRDITAHVDQRVQIYSWVHRCRTQRESLL